MYPSGSWRGFWEQRGWGRQPMHDLVLRFAQGRIEGEGRDCIGLFTFSGEYDTQGGVQLTKQYLGRHAVRYEGVYDGEGSIHGQWSIAPLWAGSFALSPIQPRPGPDAPIEDL